MESVWKRERSVRKALWKALESGAIVESVWEALGSVGSAMMNVDSDGNCDST